MMRQSRQPEGKASAAPKTQAVVHEWRIDSGSAAKEYCGVCQGRTVLLNNIICERVITSTSNHSARSYIENLNQCQSMDNSFPVMESLSHGATKRLQSTKIERRRSHRISEGADTVGTSLYNTKVSYEHAWMKNLLPFNKVVSRKAVKAKGMGSCDSMFHQYCDAGTTTNQLRRACNRRKASVRGSAAQSLLERQTSKDVMLLSPSSRLPPQSFPVPEPVYAPPLGNSPPVPSEVVTIHISRQVYHKAIPRLIDPLLESTLKTQAARKSGENAFRVYDESQSEICMDCDNLDPELSGDSYSTSTEDKCHSQVDPLETEVSELLFHHHPSFRGAGDMSQLFPLLSSFRPSATVYDSTWGITTVTLEEKNSTNYRNLEDDKSESESERQEEMRKSASDEGEDDINQRLNNLDLANPRRQRDMPSKQRSVHIWSGQGNSPTFSKSDACPRIHSDYPTPKSTVTSNTMDITVSSAIEK